MFTLLACGLFAQPGQAVPGATAAPPPPALADAGELLPVRPGLKIGKLDNGLTYYVEHNALPSRRVELRLAVDVGSVDEADGQEGLAHFVEHLAFRGTQRFPAGQLASFLAAAGMRQGPDLNATTSYEETVYRLRLPTDDPTVVGRGLDLLADWAGGMSFAAAEVDSERGAVLAEWGSSRDAASRAFDRHLPVLLAGSLYSRRPPLGQRAVLATATAADLARFYRARYHPDRMAVVAVGDLDAARMEAEIRRAFAALPAAPQGDGAPVREGLPRRAEPQASVAVDPEAQQALLSIAFLRPAEPVRSVAQYRRQLTKFLFHRALNDHLAEIAQQPGTPLALARTSEVSVVRATAATLAVAVFEPGDQRRAMESLVAEIRRMAEGGVGIHELSRHRSDLLRDMASAAAEQDRTESATLAEECVRHFLAAEPLPGIAYEYRLAQRLLPGIEPAEVQQLAAAATPLASAVVMLAQPGNASTPPPSDRELLQALAAARSQPVSPWVDRPSALLIATPPAPGPITSSRQIPSLGVTEWTFANGVKVVAKPTEFKRDEVLFLSFRPGGFSRVPDRDLVPAWTAAEVVRLGGVGNLDLPALRDALAGKAVEVSPFVREWTAGLSGSSARGDLPTAFQLLHLYLTAPREDAGAFAALQNRLKSLLGNRSADPEAALDDAEDLALTGGGPRHRPWGPGMIDEMDLGRSLAVYRDLLGDPAGATFVFVGSFDLEDLRHLAATYLGSLPSRSGQTAAAPLPAAALPRVPVERTVIAGTEPRSSVRLIFAGAMRWAEPDRTALPALGELLHSALQRRLRGELAGVYEVGVDTRTNQLPMPSYRVHIAFESAPERVEELTAAVLQEASRLRTSGIPAAELADWRRAKAKRHQDAMATNAFWLDSLQTAYALGDDPEEILRAEQRLEQLSPEVLRETAARYLDPEKLIKLVRRPRP